MSAVETEILNLSKTKPLEWKRYTDDIFALWRTDRKEIDEFIAPQEPTQSVCIADCYFIVNVLDLPFGSLIAIYR